MKLIEMAQVVIGAQQKSSVLGKRIVGAQQKSRRC